MTTLPEAKLYIDGVVRRAAGDKTYDRIGPWTGEPVGNDAIAAARRAFDSTAWATNHSFRFDLVKRLYELLLANHDRVAALCRVEAGAAMGAIQRAHVDMALGCYKELLNLFPRVTW